MLMTWRNDGGSSNKKSSFGQFAHQVLSFFLSRTVSLLWSHCSHARLCSIKLHTALIVNARILPDKSNNYSSISTYTSGLQVMYGWWGWYLHYHTSFYVGMLCCFIYTRLLMRACNLLYARLTAVAESVI